MATEHYTGSCQCGEHPFSKHAIHHLFGSTFGIQSLAVGTRPDRTEMVAVNASCLDGVDARALDFTVYDGASA